MTAQKDKPKIPNSFIILVGCVFGYLIIADAGETKNQPHTRYQTPPTPLELLSSNCSTEHGYIFITGEVKNISEKPLKNIMAVGTFRTKEGEFIKTAEALINYNPIMPGQSSPFKAGTSENPLIKNCQTTFKTLFGKSISTQYK